MQLKAKIITLLFGIITFAIVVLIVSGCNATFDNEENVKIATENTVYVEQALSPEQISYNNEYETFKRKTDSIIAENEKTIAKLKAGVNDKAIEDRERANQWLRVLGQRNKSIKRQINDYVTDDYTNWKNYKAQYTKDLENIGKALERLTKNGTK